MFFMNALHGPFATADQLKEDYHFHHSEMMFPLGEGACYVWEMPLTLYSDLPFRYEIKKLAELPNVDCRNYGQKWRSTTAHLCGVCLASRDSLRNLGR
jgi:hypothetical protein